jgi:hypothetical protein
MSSEESDDDGRPLGDWRTVYTGTHWQICIEWAYLIVLLFLFSAGFWKALSCVIASGVHRTCDLCSHLAICDSSQAPLIIVLFFFISGVLGGTLFAMKWLYHTVARKKWHCDRIIWRMCVPLMAGVLAVYVSFIFARTFGIHFTAADLDMPTIAQLSGFSFLVGIFADGVLAMLERLASHIFGTLEDFSGKK